MLINEVMLDQNPIILVEIDWMCTLIWLKA